jgi:hemolysin activation/secretion protein
VAIAAPSDAGSLAASRFDIWELRVDGNSILDPRAIETTVYPFLGPDGDLARVEQARAALETAYRDRGYATVAVVIPQQSVDDGVVRLTVEESRVDRFRVKGAKYTSQRALHDALPSLQSGTILNTARVQQEIDFVARRSRDVKLKPVIRSGRDVGTLDVELHVEDTVPLHGAVELNNYYSANTSELRLNGTLAYNNLFQRQDGLTLSYQVTPEDASEVSVFSATYIARPRTSANLFTLTGVVTDSDVAAVGGTAVIGTGTFLFARGFFPLRSEPGRSDTLIAGVDYKDAEDTTRFIVETDGGGGREEVSAKRIDYANFVVGYNGSRGASTFDATVGMGVRQLFNDHEEFEQKRFKGEPNYVKLGLDATHAQPLPWLGARLSLSAAAQLTTDHLVPNEQLSLGGVRSVRGYLESEALSDQGMVMQLELGLPAPPQMDWARQVEVFLFVDGAFGTINDPLPGEDDRIEFASRGLGLRYIHPLGVTTEAFWAHAMATGPETRANDDRVSARIGFQF